MANTQVFTLGVTPIASLGSALDALRKQADGTRLGRLIGEVIRLGLELDKVRLVERRLAIDQAWAHEQQIDRLHREGDAVEGLRRRYLALRRAIALQPPKARTVSADSGEAGVPTQSKSPPAAGGKTTVPANESSEQGAAKDSRQAPAPYPRDKADTGVVVGSIGGVIAATLAAGLFKKMPAHLQTSVKEAAHEGGPTALGKGLVALTEENEQDRARGLGAAAGELAGGVLGTLLGALTKNEKAKKYGGKIGESLGEEIGGAFGALLYDKVYADPAPSDKSATGSKATSRPNDSTSTSRDEDDEPPEEYEDEEEIEEEEEEEEAEEKVEEFEDDEVRAASSLQSTQPSTAPSQPGSALGSALLGAASLAGLAGKTSASSAGASLASRAMRRVPVLSVLATGMQLADTYNSDATPDEKLEGYGAAVGGLGGGLAGAAAGAAIGSVVPVVGTLIGGLIGGALGSMGGESIGGLLGKVLGSSADDVPTAPGPAPSAIPTPVPTAATPPAPPNQQFTFTANMPVTFTNSLSDPSVLQQLEAIARRQLEELMRQARSVQLADAPHIAL